ncbi:hypothetical protein AB4Z38_16900 [Arthrobacter sp. 2RAF6]
MSLSILRRYWMDWDGPRIGYQVEELLSVEDDAVTDSWVVAARGANG